MRRVPDLLVLAMLCAAPVLAGGEVAMPTLQSVLSRLSEATVVRGQYAQVRHIHLLDKPLESNGFFILSERGLYWEQQSPLRSVMIADERSLYARIGDAPSDIVDEASNPMAMPISRILLGIFSGDAQQLEENFSIGFEASGRDWTIELTPTSEPLSAAISHITLRGRDLIEEVDIHDRSEDETSIRFSGVETQPDHLTEHEIDLYAR